MQACPAWIAASCRCFSTCGRSSPPWSNRRPFMDRRSDRPRLAGHEMAKRFRDQVVVVTGASAGIGRELALQLAGEGALLALAGRNTQKLDQVVQECSA